MTRIILLSGIAAIVSVLGAPSVWAAEALLVPPDESVTLAPEYAAAFPLREQRIRDDSGINVLVDLAHQASFFTMWHVPRGLMRSGFRAVGSQASLDSVLDPKGHSRVRLSIDGRRPFAWWPNAKYNVIISAQSNPASQVYLPEERKALRKFVSDGGGLILIGARVTDDAKRAAWPLQQLLEEYDAAFSEETGSLGDARLATVKAADSWTSLLDDGAGAVLAAGREVGKGRVLAVGDIGLVDWNARNLPDEEEDARLARFCEWVRWAAAGTEPIGGTARLPSSAGGGGGIYPEREHQVGKVTIFYAANQKQNLLDTIENDMPDVKSKIEEWLPSGPHKKQENAGRPDMYIILSAGSGGGWAVNAYEPKEAGIISLDPEGVLSIFAHELAHTMGGPTNSAGEYAGQTPDGNQSEAHAGWFQGKIKALRTGERGSHDPNRLFDFDSDGTKLDLAMNPRQLRERWGKGKDWTKTWWIWQKLDDRYGPTWYPRWRWVQHTRRADTPNKKLTWEDCAEDMSIAVGEDLFPFLRAAGMSLSRKRFPTAKFNGERLELPAAPIEVGPAGHALFEPIHDYTLPITVSP